MPANTNPLGVKGVGEAGTTASLAAMMNAIADAIPTAPRHMDMPATLEKVWAGVSERLRRRLNIERPGRAIPAVFAPHGDLATPAR